MLKFLLILKDAGDEDTPISGTVQLANDEGVRTVEYGPECVEVFNRTVEYRPDT